MNAQGRKKIAKHVATLESIMSELEMMRDNEEDKFFNMPESLQESDRGYEIQDAMDELETAISCLEDAIDSLSNI